MSTKLTERQKSIIQHFQSIYLDFASSGQDYSISVWQSPSLGSIYSQEIDSLIELGFDCFICHEWQGNGLYGHSTYSVSQKILSVEIETAPEPPSPEPVILPKGFETIKTDTGLIHIPVETLAIMRDLWIADFESSATTSWEDEQHVYHLLFQEGMDNDEGKYMIEIYAPTDAFGVEGRMIVSHEVTITEMERAFKTLETEPEPPAPLPTASIGQVEAPPENIIITANTPFKDSYNIVVYGMSFHSVSGEIRDLILDGMRGKFTDKVAKVVNELKLDTIQMAFSIPNGRGNCGQSKSSYIPHFFANSEDSAYHAANTLLIPIVNRIDAWNYLGYLSVTLKLENADTEQDYSDHYCFARQEVLVAKADTPAETVTIVTPEIALVEKPVQEITFKVGQAVQWISKRGISSETYVICETVELASTWYKLQHPYMSNIKITAKAEHIVAYQLETKARKLA